MKLDNGIEIMRVVKKVFNVARQHMEEEMKEFNLTGPQGMLIGTLVHNDKMKVSDISERLCLTNSTVSGIIDRLESQGLVIRERSKEDRRVVYVSLTPEFRKEAKEKFHKFKETFQTIIDQATEEESNKIYEGFKTLEVVMERSKLKQGDDD